MLNETEARELLNGWVKKRCGKSSEMTRKEKYLVSEDEVAEIPWYTPKPFQTEWNMTPSWEKSLLLLIGGRSYASRTA